MINEYRIYQIINETILDTLDESKYHRCNGTFRLDAKQTDEMNSALLTISSICNTSCDENGNFSNQNGIFNKFKTLSAINVSDNADNKVVNNADNKVVNNADNKVVNNANNSLEEKIKATKELITNICLDIKSVNHGFSKGNHDDYEEFYSYIMNNMYEIKTRLIAKLAYIIKLKRSKPESSEIFKHFEVVLRSDMGSGSSVDYNNAAGRRIIDFVYMPIVQDKYMFYGFNPYKEGSKTISNDYPHNGFRIESFHVPETLQDINKFITNISWNQSGTARDEDTMEVKGKENNKTDVSMVNKDTVEYEPTVDNYYINWLEINDEKLYKCIARLRMYTDSVILMRSNNKKDIENGQESYNNFVKEYQGLYSEFDKNLEKEVNNYRGKQEDKRRAYIRKKYEASTREKLEKGFIKPLYNCTDDFFIFNEGGCIKIVNKKMYIYQSPYNDNGKVTDNEAENKIEINKAKSPARVKSSNGPEVDCAFLSILDTNSLLNDGTYKVITDAKKLDFNLPEIVEEGIGYLALGDTEYHPDINVDIDNETVKAKVSLAYVFECVKTEKETVIPIVAGTFFRIINIGDKEIKNSKYVEFGGHGELFPSAEKIKEYVCRLLGKPYTPQQDDTKVSESTIHRIIRSVISEMIHRR